jgi:hypothetical protein
MVQVLDTWIAELFMRPSDDAESFNARSTGLQDALARRANRRTEREGLPDILVSISAILYNPMV